METRAENKLLYLATRNFYRRVATNITESSTVQAPSWTSQLNHGNRIDGNPLYEQGTQNESAILRCEIYPLPGSDSITCVWHGAELQKALNRTDTET
jgi:hypothetical protein